MSRESVLEKLREWENSSSDKKIVAGFDGFVDTTVRPIFKVATRDRQAQMFETISDFADFIKSKAEKSCSIELKVESKSLGGNMPFLTQAVGTLGFNVECIGMLGELGSPEEIFRQLPGELYPFMPPGPSTCLEFDDGKILLAPTVEFEGNPWQKVLEATDGRAIKMFSNADLVALVNWSELTFSQALWNETFEAAFRDQMMDKSKTVLFDLCDISRKNEEEIEKVLRLIGRFSSKRTGVLSLNENEALVIGDTVFGGTNDPEDIATRIREDYQIDEVAIHGVYFSLMLTERGKVFKNTIFVEKPVKTTGAGDHYNGALSAGILLDFEDEEKIELAHYVANFYVSKGHSPCVRTLLEHIKEI